MSRELKVNLAIVGAQKAGTTSLLRYLQVPKEVGTQLTKEFPFFVDENLFNAGFDKALRSSFSGLEEAQYLIIKHVDLSISLEGLQRLFEHNPDCTIVYVIRNPIDRIHSAYTMELANGWLNESFEKILTDLENSENSLYTRLFLDRTKYEQSLENIYSIFPKKQVKILLFEELIANQDKIVNDILHDLGLHLPDYFDYQVHNQTTKPRNEILASFLHYLRSEKNPIKRIIRWMLPVKMYHKLAASANSMNKSSHQYEELTPEIEDRLRKLTYPTFQRVKEITEVDLTIWNFENSNNQTL